MRGARDNAEDGTRHKRKRKEKEIRENHKIAETPGV